MSAKRVLTFNIGTTGLDGTVEAVQRLRTGLADRRPLHAELAEQGGEFTRAHLRKLNRHQTATRLGAKPTLHYEKAAGGIEAASNEAAAILRIPRASGLGRAFGSYVVKPGSGKTYLTIPADKRTYGKRAGEFAPGTFSFTIIGGRYPALMFTEGWTIAYWLRRSVNQKQDRTLLPSEDAYRQVTKAVTTVYLSRLINGEGGPA